MGNSISGLRRNLETWGRSIQLSADGAPKAKAGGVTMDWTTVPAVAGSAITYEDGVTVGVGQKALRYGSVIYRIPATGLYGLADNATALVFGETYLVNETVLEEDRNSNHPAAIDGGRVFRDRIKAGGATEPTLAAVHEAVPVVYAIN